MEWAATHRPLGLGKPDFQARPSVICSAIREKHYMARIAFDMR